ncbi:MAG: YtxH domain-containing protein [Acidobacteriia bacterium]|nr:YtxH domain-containing protein [Terriglobia bacterium]
MSKVEADIVQERRSNMVAWLLVGIAIGAAVALLSAPKSGRGARQLLSKKAQQGKQAVSESTHDIIDAGRDLFDRGRKVVEDAAELFDRGRKLVKG